MELSKLISWSTKNFSHFPWRKNRNIYHTWISEVMLQQTTVHTVKNRLDDFLKKFPSVADLSKASDEELLTAWKGLGYYQRAKNLKKAAKKLVDDFDGHFPKSLDELQLIPGIGAYTSGALFSIGMNRRALAIDGNLERVISRYWKIEVPKGPKLKNKIQDLFEQEKLFTKGEISSWRKLNEALMDLGREVCQSRRTYCEICPIQDGCKSRNLKNPLDYPRVDKKKKLQKFELHLLRVICRQRGKIYCYKKQTGQWLSGQYELPTFVCFSEDVKLNQYPVVSYSKYKKLECIKTTITKYKIENYILEVSPKDFKENFPQDSIKLIDENEILRQFSTASLKALKKREEG